MPGQLDLLYFHLLTTLVFINHVLQLRTFLINMKFVLERLLLEFFNVQMHLRDFVVESSVP